MYERTILKPPGRTEANHGDRSAGWSTGRCPANPDADLTIITNPDRIQIRAPGDRSGDSAATHLA